MLRLGFLTKTAIQLMLIKMEINQKVVTKIESIPLSY